MNELDYQILTNTSASRNQPPGYAVKLLEDTCERTGLDWKRRHVYLMERGGKWGVTLSIDGFRLIGAQDPDYVGQEGPFWVAGADQTWTDIPPDGPIYASKVGVKHRNGTVTWGVAKYKDYAAGPMWTKFPSTMVAKCAEMLAWRKAFPGRLGGLYGLEEMAQADKQAAKILEGEREEMTKIRAKEALENFDKAITAEAGFIAAIGLAPSIEELKALGKRITDSDLSMQVKAEIHRIYSKRKTELLGA